MPIPSAVSQKLGATVGFVPKHVNQLASGFSRSEVFCLEDAAQNKIALKSTPINNASCVARIDALFKMQQFLSDSGLHFIAKPIPLGETAVYVDVQNQNVWFATKWIEGRELLKEEITSSVIDQISPSIGQALRTMRRSDFLATFANERRFDGFRLRASELEQICNDRSKSDKFEGLSRELKSVFGVDLGVLLRIGEPALIALQDRLAMIGSESAINVYRWCLRDIRIENCLFDSEEKLVGIIDLDAFGFSQPVFDVVRFVSSLVLPNEVEYDSVVLKLCSDFDVVGSEVWQIKTLDFVSAICGAYFWMQQLVRIADSNRLQSKPIISRLRALLLRIQSCSELTIGH